jgi:4-carboxymuconolactone decarboxylase
MSPDDLYERGIEMRRKVLGDEYVNNNLPESDDFMAPFQRALTELVWGYSWSRPGLDPKTRSLLNLAMLTALGKYEELGIYVKGALKTGVTVEEIQEVLIHATIYCGTPAGRQAFRAAHRSLKEEGVLPSD